MAPGLEAEVATSDGMGALSCPVPSERTWFVAPGSQYGGQRLRLELMNADSSPAMVNLNVMTDSGVVTAPSYTGITVPARSVVTESVSAAARGASVVAVKVRTSSGRVAAAAWFQGRHGPQVWLPASAVPARTQVIPGVPGSGSGAGLLLVNPGSGNAVVTVTALTTSGRYQPLGSQQVDLPGASASYVQLPALGGDVVGLKLTSNVPVTASALAAASGASGQLTAAVPALTQQAVFSGNVSGHGTKAEIALTAPGGAARVRVSVIGPGAARPKLISVPSGHTVTVPVSVRKNSRFAVVVMPLPGGGPVYSARLQLGRQASVESILPGLDALAAITLPPARQSYLAVSP